MYCRKKKDFENISYKDKIYKFHWEEYFKIGKIFIKLSEEFIEKFQMSKNLLGKYFNISISKTIRRIYRKVSR